VEEIEKRVGEITLEKDGLQRKLEQAEGELRKSKDSEAQIRERETALKERVEALESLQVSECEVIL